MFVPPSTGVEEPIDGAGNMDLGLTGRVAIVSAASQGLGRATAMALAAEGAHLAICARGREPFDGRIDTLVNTAGGPPAGAAESVSKEDWQAGFARNFLSVVTFCRGVLPVMKARRWGRIVNIASVSAKQPIPGLAVSNAMRAA